MIALRQPRTSTAARRLRPGANRVSTSCGDGVQILVDRVNRADAVYFEGLCICDSAVNVADGLAAVLPDTERGRGARTVSTGQAGTTTTDGGRIHKRR